MAKEAKLKTVIGWRHIFYYLVYGIVSLKQHWRMEKKKKKKIDIQ